MTQRVTAEELEKLIDLAISSKERVYAPYSKFRVGCGLLTKSGEFITGRYQLFPIICHQSMLGVNVENSSYGLSICAERTALVKAVSEGHREFKAIAVNT